MLVGITGARGFIGSALSRAALQRGWEVRALPREPDAGQLRECDAIVHLAGESVDGRWTPQKKAEIARSRIQGTRALAQAIAASGSPPRVLASASGVGYYGDRGDEPLFEESAPGNDFLARVCQEWEREAQAASRSATRVVNLRTGIVLGPGGALPKMMRPFTFGAGGALGGGRQLVPWIHLDDIVAMYLFAIESDAWSGAVNAVAPDYATSARFAQAIGAAMRRPALLPAPAFALRAVLGEFAETILGGQLVIPRKAQRAGFAWSHPRLETVLHQIIAPQRASTSLRVFTGEQRVAAPLERIFEFFSQAGNLQAITPPMLDFSLESDPGALAQGSIIAYRLKVHGIPQAWKTLIANWEPPNHFVDVQLHGPYALWEHQHTFTPVSSNETLIRDRVTYALPFYPLGGAADHFVRRDIEQIFAYRETAIAQRFELRATP